METLQITDSDWEHAKSVAHQRFDQGTKSTCFKSQYGLDKEIIGVLGELKTAEHFRKEVNFVYGIGDLADIILFGKTCDVKTSYMKGDWDISTLHLIVMETTMKTELYIQTFITQDRNQLILAGWTTKEMLLKMAKKEEWDGFSVLKMKVHALRDILTLNKCSLELWM